MAEDREKSAEIERLRRAEERRGRKRPLSEDAQLRKRMERNARELLELDLDEFLKALREDYKLNEFQIAKAKAFWLQSRGR